MIRAIIFDCDGVIADTEPLHHQAFERVLADRSIHLSREEYFGRYVGLNDLAVLRSIFADSRLPLDDQELERLLAVKNDTYLSMIAGSIEALPGVVDFVIRASKCWPLAICSGARHVEIETILRHTGLSGYFPIVVSSDDVPVSKPDPTGFLQAWSLLRQQQDRQSGPGAAAGLSAAECLVIEDSLHGIAAAKAAGMPILAVQSQCTAAQLSHADGTVPDLRFVTDDMILAM
jgi:beta-phosphoglucomutase